MEKADDIEIKEQFIIGQITMPDLIVIVIITVLINLYQI